MTTEQTWTVGALLDWTAKHLAQKGVDYPRLDAEVLLAHVLGCKRIDLYGFRFGETAGPEVRQGYRQLIQKRLEGCPVAYLVGRKEFYSLELEVTPAVLIPRPDSELVVVTCLELARKQTGPRVVDVGTGSGNLAVAVAKFHQTVQVTAIEKSPEALALARRNADKHGVGQRIRFLEGDLLSLLDASERFEFVISNPPYIPHEDLDQLPVGVRQYEPRLALDGGAGGFAVFDQLIDQARHYLEPGGYLIVEIGAPQEQTARQHLEALQEYELAATIHDNSGHPRVLQARRRDV